MDTQDIGAQWNNAQFLDMYEWYYGVLLFFVCVQFQNSGYTGSAQTCELDKGVI